MAESVFNPKAYLKDVPYEQVLLANLSIKEEKVVSEDVLSVEVIKKDLMFPVLIKIL